MTQKITQAQLKRYGTPERAALNASDVPKAKKERGRYAQKEFQLQQKVAAFLNNDYPNVSFESSITNLSLTLPQGRRFKSISDDNFKAPDMKIYYPAHGYGSIFLELKKESPYKKNGDLKKNDHLEAQWQSIMDLRSKGFHAAFYWEFSTVKEVLNWYLGG